MPIPEPNAHRLAVATKNPERSGPDDLSSNYRRIEIPFSSRISPDLGRSRRHHIAWVAERGLWRDQQSETVYRAADFPQLAARTYPWASGEDLDLVTDCLGWAFLCDDFFDTQNNVDLTERQLELYRDALHGRYSPGPENPLLATWCDLLARLHERGSAEWRVRHGARWEALFDSFLQEARNNAAEEVPSFREYYPLRRGAAGVNVVFDWIELTDAAGRFELSTQAHALPLMVHLRDQASDAISLANDVFSASSEYDTGNTDNIVHVLVRQERCTWADAARRTVGMVNDTVGRFQETEAQLRKCDGYLCLSERDRSNADFFIEGMKNWMSGSQAWHLRSPRYQNSVDR